MRLPVIKQKNNYKKSVVTFGGLNKTPYVQDGELSDCSGISHRNRPYLSVREEMTREIPCGKADGAYFGKENYIAHDGKLYRGEEAVGELTDGKKRILEHNGYILVFPDKKYYDIENNKFDAMDASYEIKGASFEQSKLAAPSHRYEKETRRITEELAPKVVLQCYKSAGTNGTTAVMHDYYEKNAEEATYGDIYKNGCMTNQYKTVKSVEQSSESGKLTFVAELVTLTDIYKELFTDFREGDIVEIENCTLEENNGSFKVESVASHEITFSDKSFTSATESGAITVRRKIPDFSCVCLYENRLWGCEGNVLYASKLGDPFNFYTYSGISTDSFTVTSNTAQPFTACAAYVGSCLFFKADGTYKLFGTRPSNFELTKTLGGGINADAADTVAVSQGSVIYCGTDGVYSSFGGVPIKISDKLGPLKIQNACAGCDNARYYLAFDTDDGKRMLYVYDADGGLWSIYGETDITGFVNSGGVLYALGEGGICTFSKNADINAKWSVTFGAIDEAYYGKKVYSSIKLKLKMQKNTHIRAQVSYDGEPFEEAGTFYSDKERYVRFPLSARRCHTMTVRLSGKGDVILQGLEREFNVG